MRPDAISRTALGTAAGRAIESFRGIKGLFEDPFAIALLPRGYRIIVHIMRLPVVGNALMAARERQLPGIAGNLLCRTRFIDDTLQSALSAGFEQLVILGAGLDTRAYRIPDADRVQVFELDHRATQAWKRQRMERALGALPSHVTFVPIDLEQQAVGEALAANGFSVGARTFFIWEGVTQYIDGKAVESTMTDISQSTAGSQVVFTYIQRRFIEDMQHDEAMKRILREVNRSGEQWIFGIDSSEIPSYLARHGLEVIEDVGAEDYRARYLRPTHREMDLFAGERAVIARVREKGVPR
jgi:methyltransferase (TIGR00027 family)